MKEDLVLEYAEMFPEWEGDLEKANIAFFNVSVFDHWLSEQESCDSEIMFYGLARSSKKLAEYKIGESKFLKFYRILSAEGVICNYPGQLRKFEKYDQELAKIIKDSVREKRRFDMHFIRLNVRVMGGYDRTDLFLPRNKDKIPDIYRAVEDAGLHVLN